MNESKCIKCGFSNETFQRGNLITGTRCLSCGYETFAKGCKNLRDLRLFIEKIPDDVLVLFQDQANVTLEAHYKGDIANADKLKVWPGIDK